MSARSDILNLYPEYEATIGIEVHVQLSTKSKIFCGCPNKFGCEPNTNICWICSGHPGVLPVLNREVVNRAILAGLATNCSINQENHFERKHYMYPDLPKNYQITQGDHPICTNGYVLINDLDGNEKKVRLNRIHMEEDAGKNIHADTGESWVDLNRTGSPLLEIVSEPDIANAHEAVSYLKGLHAIIRYLGISTANMEEGSFRADINISVKKRSAEKLGDRVEMKNINSFKFIAQAIDYEIERQIELVDAGEKIKQETRLWDNKKNQTYFMRSKEDAQDYRYLPDPDLPTIAIDQAWIEAMREKLPELPEQKAKRLQESFGLTPYETTILVESKSLADFYEKTVELSSQPKLASNWILRDVLSFLKEEKLAVDKSPVTPELLAELLIELDKGTINSKAAQEVFAEMSRTGKSPAVIIEEKDLKQIGSEEELEAIVLAIIEKNSANVEKYKAGNERLFGFFIGQAMKQTGGKANPKLLNTLFKQHLG